MMRLLSCRADGGFDLISFRGEIPPYAILSHTWSEGQEVLYDELIVGTGKEKTGYNKLRFCGERAARDGLRHFWLDTCCINKGDTIELSTAINSMFGWFQRAAKCYVRLSDVYVPAEVDGIQEFQSTWKGAFRRSRWFTRGWTLQELLAPGNVEFYSENGIFLGSKLSLEQDINAVTHIPIAALRNADLGGFEVEERIDWVSERRTTVAEDKAYCLLGIFKVFLPVNYGEGEDYAFDRLRCEIARRAGLPSAPNQ
ncbi:MAG: hypothetical protein MMC23_009768, partial [Stictis urceolatum]|nr:hypothetical protein [Stictis urceolata]